MVFMKIVIVIVIAIAFIFLAAVAIKKNKGQGEDVDDLSPTKCKRIKKKKNESIPTNSSR